MFKGLVDVLVKRGSSARSSLYEESETATETFTTEFQSRLDCRSRKGDRRLLFLHLQVALPLVSFLPLLVV